MTIDGLTCVLKSLLKIWCAKISDWYYIYLLKFGSANFANISRAVVTDDHRIGIRITGRKIVAPKLDHHSHILLITKKKNIFSLDHEFYILMSFFEYYR